MSTLSLYDSISGSSGVVVTYCDPIIPDNLWPSWIGGEHLPDVLLKQESAPSLSGSSDPHDYCCPETYVISGGGIEDSIKHEPETRLDNE
jgi:hypothetical protein